MQKNNLIDLAKHAESIATIRKNVDELDRSMQAFSNPANTVELAKIQGAISAITEEIDKYGIFLNYMKNFRVPRQNSVERICDFTEYYIANAKDLIRRHIGGTASGELLSLFCKLKDNLDSLKSGALPNGVARIKILSCVDTIAKIKSILANNHFDNDAFSQIFDYCNGIEMNLEKLRSKAFGK